MHSWNVLTEKVVSLKCGYWKGCKLVYTRRKLRQKCQIRSKFWGISGDKIQIFKVWSYRLLCYLPLETIRMKLSPKLRELLRFSQWAFYDSPPCRLLPPTSNWNCLSHDLSLSTPTLKSLSNSLDFFSLLCCYLLLCCQGLQKPLCCQGLQKVAVGRIN